MKRPFAVGIALVLSGALALAPGCAKRREKQAGERAILSDDVLFRQGIEALSKRNLSRAREHLERIQFNTKAADLMRPLVRLALADTKFYQADDISLIEARSKYLDFVTFHGDHPMAPYAQFQSGVCSLEQVNHPSRDQSQTRVAIADFSEVVRRYPGSDYARAAGDMVAIAEANLAEHDYLVGRFYLKRKVPEAASKRFSRVLDEFPMYRERDKLYFYISRALLQGENDAEAQVYLDRLVSDYPDSEFAEQAVKLRAKFPDGSGGSTRR